MKGRRIAHFKIIEELGAGAMGMVYRARDGVLGRDVALKIIRPERVETPGARNRFIQECRAAAAVNHPGIATIYQAGETDDGQLYFASELVHGQTLEDRIQQGPLPHDEVVRIGVHLARALAAAHKHGIVHRDVKPANLMLQPDGSIKILDFGLARLVAGDLASDEKDLATQTRVGTVVGTPAYMAPEQAAGDTIDARTDIFAAGSVLYASLTGRDAFKADSVAETMRRILIEEPEPLESLDLKVPNGLADTVRRAMAKRPEDRFESAETMAEALESIQRGEDPDIPQTLTRRRRKLAFIAGALALIISVSAFVAWKAFTPGFDFESRDRLLIADVDNLTDDEAFDLALRTALESDLQQSQRAVIYDRGQAAETLKLMRRDPSARIDEQTGRDICRFAGVRAMILPRVMAVGDAYELQAILIDPTDGKHVDRVRVTAAGREQVLLEGIDELARKVRKSIGESIESIREADTPVVRAVTSSWDALNYFAMGTKRWSEGNHKDAAAMYELALEKDPEFVTARASLALNLIQFLGEPERGRDLLAEARDAADALPERDRMMLEAVALHFVDENYDEALERYRMISEIYPDLSQPYNNSGRILFAQGKFEQAAEMYERAHEIDPTSSFPLANLYFLTISSMRQPSKAQEAAGKLVELSPTTANFRSMLAWTHVAQGHFTEALLEFQKILEDEPRHTYALPNAAHLLFVLGRTEEALPLYRRQHDSVQQETLRSSVVRDLSLALHEVGDIDEAVRLARGELERLVSLGEAENSADRLMRAQLDSLAGDPDSALERIKTSIGLGIDGPWARLNLAQAYALLDDHKRALDSLKLALSEGYPDPYFPLIMPMFRSLHNDPEFLALFDLEPGDMN